MRLILTPKPTVGKMFEHFETHTPWEGGAVPFLLPPDSDKTTLSYRGETGGEGTGHKVGWQDQASSHLWQAGSSSQ